MHSTFDRMHTLNMIYKTVQNINNVPAMTESTYEIRVDGQVFVGIYEKENVTDVSLENGKKNAVHGTSSMPNKREKLHTLSTVISEIEF